ncbi:cell division protein FtsQ/DivIB [Elizabethkingia sp. JS20170427COW]|uniref:cell division protein FtsQ/DivIB n=1 Tax=Elizabethkingia sp. JS20170427COW TaxID=2583851 RepID=UPI00210576F1|nr:cell division protein FtsQ [Elizabethkingia sp. JS20170427COW]
MKNKYRILKIFIVVVLLAFLLNFSLKRFGEKESVVKIRIDQEEPVYFIGEDKIKDVVKKSNPTRKIKDLEIDAIEKKISNLTAVDSANVYLNLNGELNILVKQKVPIMRINTGDRQFYLDKKGEEFPINDNYSYPCILVFGKIPKADYSQLLKLVKTINQDDFLKKYFIGIHLSSPNNYELLTNNGNFKVEIGSLDNLGFKLYGFKAFTKKYLVYQDSLKYDRISMKYNNQVVTTLKKGYKPDEHLEKDTEISNTVTGTPTVTTANATTR